MRDGIEPAADDYHFEYDWFTSNIPVWLTHLRRYTAQESLSFIEIGSWEGRSAVWLLENILTRPSCTLHCIDPWASPNGHAIEGQFDRNVARASRQGRGRLIKHRAKSLELLPTFAPESIDMIHVDGSHVAKDVLSDIVLSWRLLKVGGVMICDDYELELGIEFNGDEVSYPTVPPLERPKMAIDAFLSCFDGDYRLLHKEWQVLVEKTGGSR